MGEADREAAAGHWTEITIIDCLLPPRIERALLAGGVMTLGDAARMSDPELVRIRDLGRKGMGMVRDITSRHRRDLGEEEVEVEEAAPPVIDPIVEQARIRDESVAGECIEYLRELENHLRRGLTRHQWEKALGEMRAPAVVASMLERNGRIDPKE